MAMFRFEGIDKRGEKRSGELQAASLDLALRELHGRGLSVRNVVELGAPRARRSLRPFRLPVAVGMLALGAAWSLASVAQSQPERPLPTPSAALEKVEVQGTVRGAPRVELTVFFPEQGRSKSIQTAEGSYALEVEAARPFGRVEVLACAPGCRPARAEARPSGTRVGVPPLALKPETAQRPYDPRSFHFSAPTVGGDAR